MNHRFLQSFKIITVYGLYIIIVAPNLKKSFGSAIFQKCSKISTRVTHSENGLLLHSPWWLDDRNHVPQSRTITKKAPSAGKSENARNILFIFRQWRICEYMKFISWRKKRKTDRKILIKSWNWSKTAFLKDNLRTIFGFHFELITWD